MKRDYHQALYWYYKAAEKGSTPAENNLGIMYEHGEGVERDYSMSARWFATAANHGDAHAQYNLATLYASGKGVPLDYLSAYFWYSLAASAEGNPVMDQLRSISKVMTPRQIQEAKVRVLSWHRAGNPND
jgi:TPR repeat protein